MTRMMKFLQRQDRTWCSLLRWLCERPGSATVKDNGRHPGLILSHASYPCVVRGGEFHRPAAQAAVGPTVRFAGFVPSAEPRLVPSRLPSHQWHPLREPIS